MATIHPRSDWTLTLPAGPAFAADELAGVVVHWNGPAVELEPAALLRADRRYHVLVKGWADIAYNLAVDQAGDVWIARGLDARSSANGSTDANRRYVAVLAMIGEGQHPTPAMLEGLRLAVQMVRGRWPTALEVATHNDVRPTPTECPGPDLTHAVHTGQLEPRPPAPPPATPEAHPPMYVFWTSDHDDPEHFYLVFSDGHYKPLTKAEADDLGHGIKWIGVSQTVIGKLTLA